METWGGGLAVDFGATGLWNYDSSSWDLLTTNNPQCMEALSNGLAVGFDAFGLWNYDGTSWSKKTTWHCLLTTSDAQDMEGWDSDLAVDLGTGGCGTMTYQRGVC